MRQRSGVWHIACLIPGAMCEEARQLLQFANEAALDFSKALSSLLLGDLQTPHSEHYDSLRQAVKVAHARSTAANHAFEAHLSQHNCDAANFDSETPKRAALYADVA